MADSTDNWPPVSSAELRAEGFVPPNSGVRVELRHALNQPTVCKVWRDGVLVFHGRTFDPSEMSQSPDEHRCGDDYNPWCDGCRAAYGDAGRGQ